MKNIHFAEEPFRREEIADREILEHLKRKGQIQVFGNYVVFDNFCGFIDTYDKNILIIPKKLAKLFDLIYDRDLPEEDFLEKYNKKFERFLNFILNELSKESIIFTLGLSRFPVEESNLNSSLIFKVLLLLEKKEELINSLHLILSNPHRKLVKYSEYKNFEEIRSIDGEILVDMVSNPQLLCKTKDGIIENNYSPLQVLQYEVDETFDTIENRFVKYFLKELDKILSEELKGFMFLKELKNLKGEIEYTLQSDIFSEVSNLNYFPVNSQVLMKKAGYREIFQTYRLFHLSFVPTIFRDLDMAFSLKDMATLWEYYVLINILREFKKEFGDYEVEIDFEERSKYKTEYEEAKFRFEVGLILYFQKTKISYTGLEFRPDFFIEYNGKSYIFDAKFRIFEDNKQDILKNMHHYKDGLKLISAVVACLGKENKRGIFWQVDKKKQGFTSFNDIIKKVEGIGYINLILKIE